METRKLTRI